MRHVRHAAAVRRRPRSARPARRSSRRAPRPSSASASARRRRSSTSSSGQPHRVGEQRRRRSPPTRRRAARRRGTNSAWNDDAAQPAPQRRSSANARVPIARSTRGPNAHSVYMLSARCQNPACTNMYVSAVHGARVPDVRGAEAEQRREVLLQRELHEEDRDAERHQPRHGGVSRGARTRRDAGNAMGLRVGPGAVRAGRTRPWSNTGPVGSDGRAEPGVQTRRGQRAAECRRDRERRGARRIGCTRGAVRRAESGQPRRDASRSLRCARTARETRSPPPPPPAESGSARVMPGSVFASRQ